jgi:polyphosphate kinase
MHRNLDRRVESMVRIDRLEHKNYLQELLDLGLSDDSISWHLHGSTWKRIDKDPQGKPLKDVQEFLIQKSEKAR